MAIINLVRDYGVEPCIVRMMTTDDYATISAAGYLDTQMAAFNRINGGAFQWAETDVVLANYNGGWAFFTISPDFENLNPFFPAPGFTEFLGDTGSAAGPIISVLGGASTTVNSGSSVYFAASGSTILLNTSDSLDNTTIGLLSGNPTSTGASNTALGAYSLRSVTSGAENIAIGNASLLRGQFVTQNISIGVNSLNNLITGSYNTAIGQNSLFSSTNDSSNTAIGSNSLFTLNGGTSNLGIGLSSLQFLQAGSNNLAIGNSSGVNYTSTESGNILFNSEGVLGESNTLRIGSATGTGASELNAAYIYGIDGADVGSVATVVTEAGDRLGTAVITAGTGISITPSANTITITATGLVDGTSLIGDTGTANGAAVNVISGLSTNNSGSTVEFVGDGVSTLTLNVTNYLSNVLIGRLCGNAFTSGERNVGLGASALSAASTCRDNVCIGSSSGADITIGSFNTGVGSASLRSNTAGSFNTAVGYSSLSSSSGYRNTAVGNGALSSSLLDDNNCAFGFGALEVLDGGAGNCGFGSSSFTNLATGDGNCGFGRLTLNSLLSGSYNIGIGNSSGSNYTTSESSNILLNSQGVITDANTLRIGESTGSGDRQLNKAFICGIDGIDVGSVATVVTESGDQLGTAVITAGTGIAITPGANTITISSTASGFAWSTIAGTTQSASVNNGYIVGNAAITTITLPATFLAGDTIIIKGLGAGGWILESFAGTVIYVGQMVTSSGGTVSSADNFDVIRVSGLVADTSWSMESSVSRGFTVA